MPIIFLLAYFLVQSCAGPINPFGSELLPKTASYLPKNNINDNELKIKITPDRQNLHDAHQLELKITSKDEPVVPNDLVVVWNGEDITNSFKKVIDYSYNQTTSTFKLRNFRLISSEDHELEFYIKHKGQVYYKKYQLPECNIYSKEFVSETGSFEVSRDLVNVIQQTALVHDINPSLLTGLIAAESSFKPTAVSSAKAIGLTQVTNLGHLEIQKSFPDWKIDKRTKRFPASVIKALVKINEIDSSDDWRLNKKKSILGGTNYLLFLKDYWEKKALSFKIGTGEMTDLILASYNSGAARVKNAFKRNPRNWKKSKNLVEANKYIKRISSYCYHFSKNDNKSGVKYENKTTKL